MRPRDGVWIITLDGEADDTFECLLGDLSGLVVEVEPIGDAPFDAVLIDAHKYQPTDDDGSPLGEPRHLDRVASVHVY